MQSILIENSIFKVRRKTTRTAFFTVLLKTLGQFFFIDGKFNLKKKTYNNNFICNIRMMAGRNFASYELLWNSKKYSFRKINRYYLIFTQNSVSITYLKHYFAKQFNAVPAIKLFFAGMIRFIFSNIDQLSKVCLLIQTFERFLKRLLNFFFLK